MMEEAYIKSLEQVETLKEANIQEKESKHIRK